MGDWGTLDGGVPVHASPAKAMAGGWGVLDGKPPAEHARIPGQPAPHHDRPSPEATGSLLRAGEIVWAKVERTGATLGSGQVVKLVTAPADGLYGWRLVRVLEPARLLVEAVAVPEAKPLDGAGHEPSALYRAAPPAAPPGVARGAGFPVGFGAEISNRYEQELRDVHRRADVEREAMENEIYRLRDQVRELTLTVDRLRRTGGGLGGAFSLVAVATVLLLARGAS